jgi:hypothetical protein
MYFVYLFCLKEVVLIPLVMYNMLESVLELLPRVLKYTPITATNRPQSSRRCTTPSIRGQRPSKSYRRGRCRAHRTPDTSRGCVV